MWESFHRQHAESTQNENIASLLENNEIGLICPELASNEDRLTGLYKRQDCTGVEKANRVKEKVNLSDFTTIYAYGDTKEDHALLALAHEPYYQWKKAMAT